MSNTGGPAFPLPNHTKRWNDIEKRYEQDEGMTLRDYLAAHAPEPAKNWHGGERSTIDIVQWRWAYADAMLKAREQK